MRDKDSTDIPEEPIKNFASRHVKRMQGLARVESRRFVGKRGGIRDPIAIVWRTHGTGLFRHVEKGTGKTALFPWVKYGNGKGSVKSVRADEWRDWAERWLPVVGYEGYYEVSDHGRVRGLDRSVPYKGRGKVRISGKVLRGIPCQSGHHSVVLYGLPLRRRRRVHHLVLEAFFGPCPDGMECRHLNDEPLDNRLINLAWGTRLENVADRERNGRTAHGESHGNTFLTEAEITAIRDRYARGGESQKRIGEDYGASQSGISRIVNRDTWARIP